MWGPTPKYRNTTSPSDGVPWFWNVHSGGYPVKQGDAPDLIPRNAPVSETLIPTAQSKVFEVPKDLPEYVKVMDWIANGMAVKYSEEKRPGKDEGTWYVWLTWFDLSGHVQIDTNGKR
jgi:hypothetical protein